MVSKMCQFVLDKFLDGPGKVSDGLAKVLDGLKKMPCGLGLMVLV